MLRISGNFYIIFTGLNLKHILVFFTANISDIWLVLDRLSINNDVLRRRSGKLKFRPRTYRHSHVLSENPVFYFPFIRNHAVRRAKRH